MLSIHAYYSPSSDPVIQVNRVTRMLTFGHFTPKLSQPELPTFMNSVAHDRPSHFHATHAEMILEMLMRLSNQTFENHA